MMTPVKQNAPTTPPTTPERPSKRPRRMVPMLVTSPIKSGAPPGDVRAPFSVAVDRLHLMYAVRDM